MKKIFIVFAFLAALVFVASPSLAVYSIDDNVPGRDVFLPFFLVKIGTTGEDTLLVIQEIGKQGGTAAVNNLEYFFYDRSSNFKGDGDLQITKYGVVSASIRDLIAGLQEDARTDLKIDLDGDGTNDHYAGYIKIQNNTGTLQSRATVNNLVAFVYQIDTASGFAAGLNCPVPEYVGNDYADSALVNAVALDKFSGDEIYHGDALVAMKYKQFSGEVIASTWFKMFPRYYVLNADSKNYLFIWKNDKQATKALFNPHFNFWNTAEEKLSGTLDLHYELNVVNMTEPTLKIPSGLHSGYPKAGWIEVQFPDKDGDHFVSTRQWWGANYQKAYLSSTELNYAWLWKINRDAGTVGTDY